MLGALLHMLRKRPRIIHFGATDNSARKIGHRAQRNPEFDFVEINCEGLKHEHLPKPNPQNVLEVKADFLTGLRKEKDGSIPIMRSDMTLGYYGKSNLHFALSTPQMTESETSQTPPEMRSFEMRKRKRVFEITRPKFDKIIPYTADVLNLAHKKLRKNGVMTITVSDSIRYGTNGYRNVMDAIHLSPFDIEKAEIRPLTQKEADAGDLWVRSAFRATKKDKGTTVWHITLRK